MNPLHLLRSQQHDTVTEGKFDREPRNQSSSLALSQTSDVAFSMPAGLLSHL